MKRAFTIIEFILTIAILGILATVLAPGLWTSIKGYDLVSTRKNILAETKTGMERMVREMRLIPGSAQVISVGATNFQFQYPAGTSITYSLSGTNLLRNSDTLMGNVSSLAFTYYDEVGNTTSTPANVRSVGIQFTIDSPGTIANFTLRTRVFLRNTGNFYASYTSP